jgi:hypothetical protein
MRDGMKLSFVMGAAAMAAALFFIASPAAHAMDFRHAREQRDLSPALKQSLSDKVSDDAAPYFNAEDEKKAKKEPYADLQEKYEYLPNWGPHNQLSTVSVKLGGAVYDPTKPGSSKGAATGTLKYLVLTYVYHNGKWVEISKPKWEVQNLGATAGKQMTENIARGDKNKAVREKATKVHAAAAAAAAAAQKAANKGD